MREAMKQLEAKEAQGEDELFFEYVADAKYVPRSTRNKRFWKLTTDTLNQMCKENPIFMRGLLSVVVTEHQDRQEKVNR